MAHILALSKQVVVEVLGELRVALLTVVRRADVLVSLALDGAPPLRLVASIHVGVVVAVDGGVALIATQAVQVLPLTESVEVVDRDLTLIRTHLELVRLARTRHILLQRTHRQTRNVPTLVVFFKHTVQN